MSHQLHMNRRKLIVNNIVGISIIIVIITQLLFFKLIAIMSVVVYPMAVFIPYGLYAVYKTIINYHINLQIKIIKIALKIFYIILSVLFLNMLFSYPNITLSYIIYFISIPTSIIGLAGFLKGVMINVYSPLFRFLNILIGMFTVFYTSFAIIFSELNFIFHLITLLTVLSFNGILRAALYLSEYGLKLNKMKSFKIVFYIIDTNPTVKNIEESHF